MVPSHSLNLPFFLYVCFLSLAHSQNIFSWPYYETFVLDWRQKFRESPLKNATSPSAVSESLSFLEDGRNEHSGDVWGLWDYPERGFLWFKFNLAQYGSLFCGITSASLRIKYYSEGETRGRIFNCTVPTGDNPEDEPDPCGLLPTDTSKNWGDVSKPVRIHDNVLEFAFTTDEGTNLLIDEVSITYNSNPNDPECQQPQPGRWELEHILNQFMKNFQQFFFSFLNIFG